MKIIKNKSQKFTTILSLPHIPLLISFTVLIIFCFIYTSLGIKYRTEIPNKSVETITNYINNDTNKENIKKISPYITIEKKEDLKTIVMQYDKSHYQDSTFEIVEDTLLKLKKININNKVNSIIFNGNDISSSIINNNSSEEYLKKVVAENEENDEGHQNILVIKIK